MEINHVNKSNSMKKIEKQSNPYVDFTIINKFITSRPRYAETEQLFRLTRPSGILVTS